MAGRSGRERDGDVLARLPTAFRSVPYAGSRFPGAAAVAARPAPAARADCRLLGCAVQRHVGLSPAPLRSRELWHDTAATVRVHAFAPLDLLLFDATCDARDALWISVDRPVGSPGGRPGASDAVPRTAVGHPRPGGPGEVVLVPGVRG